MKNNSEQNNNTNGDTEKYAISAHSMNLSFQQSFDSKNYTTSLPVRNAEDNDYSNTDSPRTFRPRKKSHQGGETGEAYGPKRIITMLP